MDAAPAILLTVFVYGTLKRGGRFHDELCRGVLSVVEASVWGKLSMLPAGYPVLDVPEDAILARGTGDPIADVATEERIRRSLADTSAPRPEAGWEEVRGELLGFDDPERRLPALDRLEGYRPGRASLYRRVIVAARPLGAARPTAAWVYVRGGGLV